MINNSNKENKLNKFREKATEWIIKYWFLINLLFIVVYTIYVVIKILVGKKSVLYTGTEQNISWYLFWFSVNLAGYGIISYSFFSKIKFKIWQFTGILFIGYIIATLGFVKSEDPNLKWTLNDVAIGNYIAAEEGVKYGVFDLIRNWNDRANPYDTRNFNDVCDTVRIFIEKYNLQGISFDKWKTILDSSRYDMYNNNRPWIHPPLTPVAMTLWMNIFPFGKWSAEMLMRTFTLLSVLLVIIYTYKKENGNFNSIIILSLITSSVLYRFHSPSADQVSMFLFTIPIFFYILFPSKKFSAAFFYGIIYGLCFYTKFLILLFIFVMIISLFIYYKKLTFRFVTGFLIGLLVPVIIMTSLGYYFWLTLISGQIFASVNNAMGEISVLNLSLKLLYYGPCFLLLFIYLLINSNKLGKHLLVFFIPIIISIFITMAAAPADWNRYLIHYMPSILLFILSMNNTVELKKKDLVISLIANVVFFHLNNYF